MTRSAMIIAFSVVALFSAKASFAEDLSLEAAKKALESHYSKKCFIAYTGDLPRLVGGRQEPTKSALDVLVHAELLDWSIYSRANSSRPYDTYEYALKKGVTEEDLCYARLVVKTVTSFTEPVAHNGMLVSTVYYSTRIDDVAFWAVDYMSAGLRPSPGQANGLPWANQMRYEFYKDPRNDSAMLVKTNVGWVHSSELR